MRAESARKIESAVDRAASGLFALAAACASTLLVAARLGPAEKWAAAAVVSGIAYFASIRVLRSIEPKSPRLPVPVFDVREMDPIDADELLLTDPYVEEPSLSEGPVLLDDIVGELAPDSRVVRLFDAAAMPTPGQLDERIRQHLETACQPMPSQDASQALHEALAELRRSLR